jgi:hypothetical protein
LFGEGGKAMMQAVVVLGLKRGGTSVTCRVLEALGVWFGDDLAPADAHNPDGYFEDRQFAAAVDRLVLSSHLREGLVVSGDPGALGVLQGLIDARNAAGRLWGLKNFGLAYCLPELTKRVGGAVGLVRVDRPFAECCASWCQVNAANGARLSRSIEEQAHLLFNADVVWARHRGPRFRLDYHGLLADPAGVVRSLAAFVGQGAGAVARAAALVDPGRRHLRSEAG